MSNNILIDSNIIKNKSELAQINDGIKHQLKKTIKKINLLYRCSRDDDSISAFHKYCNNHKNVLFLVENKENYYIVKGKSALCLDNRGIKFSRSSNNGSEFHISNKEPCLTVDNSFDDTGSNNCYYYGGRKHVLAGKKQFTVLDYEVFELQL